MKPQTWVFYSHRSPRPVDLIRDEHVVKSFGKRAYRVSQGERLLGFVFPKREQWFTNLGGITGVYDSREEAINMLVQPPNKRVDNPNLSV